ncbi:MAG: DUF2336 domain-containing protein [Proteobacteria bacterium]|nr:DUF2336 domain-containing protein [Pseudomonadota bacterium]
MLAVFKKILNVVLFKPDQNRDPERYEREKDIARSDDAKQRMTLAQSTETHQEILYYLAGHDPDPAVRQAVAVNKSTPLQASVLLAKDSDVDVRYALAERMVKLLPDLERGRQSQLYAFAVQALGTLALDEVLKIRRALSSTLKDYAHTPPKIAGQLARDVEREVSEPILRFCAAVPDADLLDILKNHPAPWAVRAIAGRAAVSEKVSHAVIKTDDRPAGVMLMENKGADISAKTLEIIIEKAKHYPEWQKPVSVHKSLSAGMAAALAEFADASVREILLKRGDFDKKSVEGIAAVFRRRLEFADVQDREKEDPAQKAVRLEKEGVLSEEAISDALAMSEKEFVYAAIARRARTSDAVVKKIFEMKAAKPIVALCWKADLTMRFALQLQKEIGRVPAKDLIYPRGGTDYPLTEDELLWQLEFLGLKAA